MDSAYALLKKEFGLRDKHIIIIQKLNDKKLSAYELCKETSIPQGRIYEYINELVSAGIIEKHGRKPAVYAISDLKKNLLWFTKHRIDGLIHSQSDMMSALHHGRQETVELIDSSMKFTHIHMRMIAESKIFRGISVHRSFPYVLYPESVEDFLEVRKIITHARPTITHNTPELVLMVYRCYMDALKSGCRCELLFERESFDFHIKLLKRWLQPKRFNAIIGSIIGKLTKYNIRVGVIDEYSPMEIECNEKNVCMIINYVGVTNGILITSKDAVNFVGQMFDAKANRSKDVLPLLKKALLG